jgi:hypothetical protein
MFVDDRAEDDVAVFVGRFHDQRRGLVDLVQAQVGPEVMLIRMPVAPLDGHVLEQRAVDRLLGSGDRPRPSSAATPMPINARPWLP